MTVDEIIARRAPVRSNKQKARAIKAQIAALDAEEAGGLEDEMLKELGEDMDSGDDDEDEDSEEESGSDDADVELEGKGDGLEDDNEEDWLRLNQLSDGEEAEEEDDAAEMGGDDADGGTSSLAVPLNTPSDP